MRLCFRYALHCYMFKHSKKWKKEKKIIKLIREIENWKLEEKKKREICNLRIFLQIGLSSTDLTLGMQSRMKIRRWKRLRLSLVCTEIETGGHCLGARASYRKLLSWCTTATGTHGTSWRFELSGKSSHRSWKCKFLVNALKRNF